MLKAKKETLRRTSAYTEHLNSGWISAKETRHLGGPGSPNLPNRYGREIYKPPRCRGCRSADQRQLPFATRLEAATPSGSSEPGWARDSPGSPLLSPVSHYDQHPLQLSKVPPFQ